MESFLSCNHFVSRKEYDSILKEKDSTVVLFELLKTSDTLDLYCEKNNLSSNEIINIITNYRKFNVLIEEKNNEYIRNKMIEESYYLDHILDASDPNIMLDDNQREVILSDEDYSLVIAGAGAGKTTTIASKVKIFRRL